ncbi:uncharacterized protein M6B38_117955 [Iris pallida]|uniref:DUF674 family protein n=1 Tax=Iris pallida TaxID=29817 RepID=A0AAX6HKM5_IRIPA|nr:uncharacterized protein M6B38_117955 [Iris pallida]
MASQQQQLMLKLLIDNSSDKVLFAEAGKDVVDFLFSLLSIPVGTVVKLLATEGMPMVGCIGNLYKSVERLDDSCLQSGHARTMLLNPTLPSAASITKNTLSLTGASPGGAPSRLPLQSNSTGAPISAAAATPSAAATSAMSMGQLGLLTAELIPVAVGLLARSAAKKCARR